MKLISVIISFWVFNTIVSAQRFPVTRYTAENGIVNSNVYRIYQDKKGFIWFCTDIGIEIYDGQRFYNYLNKNETLDNAVMSLSEDDSGRKIACVLYKGLVMITDTAIYKYPLSKGHFPPKSIYALSSHEVIWMIGEDGKSNLYKIQNHEIQQMSIRDKMGNEVVFYKIIKTKNGIIAAASDGIYKLTSSKIEKLYPEIIDGEVYDVKLSDQGVYWVGCKNTLVGIDKGKKIRTYTFNTQERIANVLVCKNTNIWVSFTGCKVFLINDQIPKDITGYLGFEETIANDLLEDTEGNIWIGTYNAGILKCRSTDIIEYPVTDNKLNLYCTAFEGIDDKTMLIGSMGSVCKWDGEKIRPVIIKLLKKNDYIYFIRKIDDVIYIGTPYSLIKKQTKYPYSEKYVRSVKNTDEGVTAIFRDSKNRIWVGAFNKLFLLKNDTLHVGIADTSLTNKRIYSIAEDSKGNIWIGTKHGVVIFDGYECRVLKEAGKIVGQTILSIVEDTYKRIWLGSNEGLICYDNGKLKYYTVKDGLRDRSCYELVPDKHNLLWIVTGKGINYLNLSTLQISQCDLLNTNDEILSVYTDNDTMLWIGTSTKIMQAKNGIGFDDTFRLPTYITSAITHKQELKNPISISLPHNQTKLQINFMGLYFRNQALIEYRYKIMNLSEDWSYTQNPSVELPALPPGNYLFVLNSRKPNGLWSKDVTLPVYVSTPVHKKWWFILLMAICTLGITVMITRYIIMKKESGRRTRLLQLNKIAYLKQQALSALINPHFIFNSLNSVQYYLNNHDNDLANSYLADFGVLIRATMEHAQHGFISLETELTRLRLYMDLEKIRIGDKMSYMIHVDDNVNMAVKIPNMILQPYAENAIWHGIMPKEAPGSINIKVCKTGNSIKIIITDSGIGISISKCRKQTNNDKEHYGMQLTEDRLSLLKLLFDRCFSVSVADLVDESGNISGTKVEIVVPLSYGENEIQKLEEVLKKHPV